MAYNVLMGTLNLLTHSLSLCLTGLVFSARNYSMQVSPGPQSRTVAEAVFYKPDAYPVAQPTAPEH